MIYSTDRWVTVGGQNVAALFRNVSSTFKMVAPPLSANMIRSQVVIEGDLNPPTLCGLTTEKKEVEMK